MGSPLRIKPGERYGKLVTVKVQWDTTKHGQRWLFRCDCGRIKEMNVASVRHTFKKRGHISCGCDHSPYNGLRHGHRRQSATSLTYNSWRGAMNRCYCHGDSNWETYGGRGITVCERWHRFENFLADMGERPSPLHSISRKGDKGNYEPGNVKWEIQYWAPGQAPDEDN